MRKWHTTGAAFTLIELLACQPKPWRRQARSAFTLIELLVALAIFSLAAAMSGGIFWSITKAWNRGGEMLEQLHYGEFAMEQLVTALRGAAWFPSKPEAFGFWLDPRGGTSKTAANEISWVTSGTAFLPPDSPFQHGLHRLSVTVDGSREDRALVVQAWPHLAEEVDGMVWNPGGWRRAWTASAANGTTSRKTAGARTGRKRTRCPSWCA
jgi:prepilin-type N-terminal cleavage/methylation domain-containing protein